MIDICKRRAQVIIAEHRLYLLRVMRGIKTDRTEVRVRINGYSVEARRNATRLTIGCNRWECVAHDITTLVKVYPAIRHRCLEAASNHTQVGVWNSAAYKFVAYRSKDFDERSDCN